MNAADFGADLLARLDTFADAGRRIDVWWRDDDAVAPSAALEDLLATAARFDVPLVLAVIPEPAEPALGERLSNAAANVTVSQHGYAHRNHAPKGEKAAELGDHRAAGTVLAELVAGREKLEGLFGPRFVPVLTPPWNRIGAAVARRRGEAGLVGLSTFARMHADDPACVNTHIDVIDWKGGRKFAGFAKMAAVVEEELSQRTGASPAPIGLLTHHLDHDDGVRGFLDAFLSVAADHPALRWPSPAGLFGSGLFGPGLFGPGLLGPG